MNRRNLIIMVLIAALCVVAIYFFDAEKTEAPAVVNQGIKIYYIDSETNNIKSENVNVEGSGEKEIIENAFNALKSKPVSEALVSVVPGDINFINCHIEDGTVKINLSNNYHELDKKTELYCRSVIIKTITGLEFADKAEIYVAGKPLMTTNGTPIGAISEEDFITTYSIVAEPTTSVKVIRLYFASDDYSTFNTEDRKIEINRNQAIEKYVVEEVIKGPSGEGSISVIPVETKVRNVMTQDKVCYVDLSAEFVSKQSDDSNKAFFAIYTIVNSLTRLDDIEKVQFLIEGEKQPEYKGLTEFSQPFEPKR